MSQLPHPPMTHSPVGQRIFVALALLFLCALLGVTTVPPQATPACDARNLASCTTTCSMQIVHHNGGCRNVTVPGHWECYRDLDTGQRMCDWVDPSTERDCWDESWDWENVCTETCTNDAWVACTGTCPTGGSLECQGGCNAGANCRCVGSSQSGCNSAADCTGNVECPYSQQGGASWTCQANQCISVCGDANNTPAPGGGGATATPIPATATPVPSATPRATPTRTPMVTPTPILPYNCPPNPEDLGGSVSRVIPPPTPDVQITYQPQNPVVVGQDPTQRGVDLNTAISVYPCTIDWHYRVLEDYVWCGKATCNCTVDDCELRQRWKEWDETCTENYALAGVAIRGDLSTDSANFINGELQTKYPGVRVQQRTFAFFPNSLARVLGYGIGNPTTWRMQGNKYPLQDPGNWDVAVNVATQPTIHCGPLAWTIPFPKKLPVYLREQTLTK